MPGEARSENAETGVGAVRTDLSQNAMGVFVRNTTPASVKAIRFVRTGVRPPGARVFWRYRAFERSLHARATL